MSGVILFLICFAYIACVVKKRRVNAQLGIKNKRLWQWDSSRLDQDKTGFDCISMWHEESDDDSFK